MGNKGGRFGQDFEDAAGYAQIGAFALPPEEIDGPGMAPEEGCNHPAAVIIHMHPVADLHAVAVDGNRLVMKGGVHEGGDQFFGVLAGTVVVAGTRDDDVLFVAACGSEAEEIGSGLGSG